MTVAARHLMACAVAACAGLWAAAPAESQVARGVQYLRSGRVAEWVELVQRHVPGRDDEALAVLAAWNSADLEGVLSALAGLPQMMRNPDARFFSPPPRAGAEGGPRRQVLYHPSDVEAFRRAARIAKSQGDFNRLVKLGAFLHGDLELLRPAEPGRGDADARSVTVFFTDGQQLARQGTTDHMGIARRLLDRILRDPGRDDIAAPAADADVLRWYQSMARVLLQRQMLTFGHFARALELFPRDAEILFLVGSVRERLADAGVQAVLRSARLPPVAGFDIGSARDELDRAEPLFRRALAIAPDHAEARLRRARVLSRLGRAKDALAELGVMLVKTSDPRLRYYAELSMGEAAEAIGDMTSAAAAYERARALYPRAQSPILALSQLALRTGSRSTASTLVNGRLKTTGSTTVEDDPWWSYYPVAGRDGEESVVRMYAEFAARRG